MIGSAQHTKGMTTFGIIWVGSVISWLGSGLSAFALGTSVYAQTGSVTRFALIQLMAVLPPLVVAPFAGLVIDRVSRKAVLMACTAVPALVMFTAAYLSHAGLLTLPFILLVSVLDALCVAFYAPAFSASLTLLVPTAQLGRASGLAQLGGGLAQIAAPVLGGLLLTQTSLTTILALDASTFLVLLFALGTCSIPQPTGHGTAERPAWSMAELAKGFTYITERAGLLGILLYFAVINFGTSLASIMLTPLLLQRTTPDTLGMVLSIAGVGMLAGGVVMSVWAGPARKMVFILGSGAIIGIALTVGAFHPTTVFLAAAAFVAMACIAPVNTTSQVLWQTKVPPALQGRVFAVRNAIAMCAMPLSCVLAGPLADHVFEPAMQSQHAWTQVLGSAFGTGGGRGMAAMVFLAGVGSLMATGLAFLHPRVRNLEQEIPDALPDANSSRPSNASVGAAC